MNTRSKGFTLIELLVVIAIIGIILAYAIPSYQRQVIESKRIEGKNRLTEIAAAQERHNAIYNQYATNLGGTQAEAALGLPTTAVSTGYYNVDLQDSTNGYTLRATAQGGQSNDTFGPDNCTVLTLNGLGQKMPLSCWQ